MPIYEYKCLDCGSQFEKMQKVSDSPLTVCEKCSGKLEKQWSLSGFQFKGEGWYVSEYGKKNHPKETKTDKKSTETTTVEKSTTESTTKTETTASKETAATSKTE